MLDEFPRRVTTAVFPLLSLCLQKFGLMEKKVLIVGCSPGVYMCAIYAYTANIPVMVLHQEGTLEYVCGEIPGCPGISKEEFAKNCKKQAQNMGISVIDVSKVELEMTDEGATVMADGNTYKCAFVVMDTLPPGFSENEFLCSISGKMPSDDAIVVSSTGCKIAFMIKEHFS